MTAAVAAQTRGGSASNTTTVTVVAPASTAIGDLLIAVMEVRSAVSGPLCSPDAGNTGWTRVLSDSTGTNATLVFPNGGTSSGNQQIFWKFATVAGAQSYGFTLATAQQHTWQAFRVTGANVSGPTRLGYNTVGAASSGATSAVTTTEDGTLLLRLMGGVGTSTLTWTGTTWDAATTKVEDVQGSGATTGAAFGSSARETGPTPAGAVAARTVALTNTPTGWGTVTLQIPAAPTGAPSNTVAPAVTGTPADGSVLSTDNGTWDQVITSYAYQWRNDGVNIAGATGSTYTVVSGDAGHTVRCVVSGTNANGTGVGNSNGVPIPAAPVNTVAPVITTDGTPATGETITVDTGTWTGTGITYTYQWYRGASPIAGETTSAYALVVTDEGANISCRVTATNGGGTATANSNTIVPAVTAPISDASFLNYLSGGTGNTDPALSIGGARGGTWAGDLNSLLGPIAGSVAQAGGTFYRVVYVRNTHTLSAVAAMKLYIESQYADDSGLQLAVAVPTQAADTPVPALASGTTAPTGVTWVTTTDPAAGADFGTLAPGSYRGIYIRLTVAAGATPTPEADATWAAAGNPA